MKGEPLTENVADVIKFMCVQADQYLTFPVPNSFGHLPRYLQGVIYLKTVKPTPLDATSFSVEVTYGVIDAVPAPDIGGPKPEEKPGNELCGPEYSFDTQGGTSHILQSIGPLQVSGVLLVIRMVKSKAATFIAVN